MPPPFDDAILARAAALGIKLPETASEPVLVLPDKKDIEQPARRPHKEAPLELAKRGFAIFPCKHTDKTPLTAHGFKDATTDEDQITAWWQKDPRAMIGVATGAMSGFFALDLDDKNGKEGSKRIAGLEAAHGALPRTVSQRTPSGGRHLLFKMPSDGRRVPSLTDVAGYAGIDTRGDGGYIVIAPSVMRDGRAYEFVVPLSEPMAEAPAWLLDLIGQKSKHGDGKPIGQGDVAPGFRDGFDTSAITSPADMPPWFRRVADALCAINNKSIDRQTWIDILHAVKQAVAGSENFYDLIVGRWNARYEGKSNGLKYDRDCWDSITATTVGWDKLRDRARAQGWEDPGSAEEAAAEFSDGQSPSPDAERFARIKNAPDLKLGGGYLRDAPNEAEEVLKKVSTNIFCYGEKLVHTAIADINASDERVVRGLRLLTMKTTYLRKLLTEAVHFMSPDPRKQGQWKAVNCPKDLAESILERGTWSFPQIRGFTNCPLFLKDGTILSSPGYDEASKIFYVDGGLRFSTEELATLKSPTRDDAIAALGRLKELIAEMPYKGSVDRSGALALMLSSLARYAVDFTPLFGVTATGSRQGKSKHADIAAVFAEGHAASATPPGSEINELEKQLATCLRYGDSVISLDNIVFAIGNNALINSCLTQLSIIIRLFGRLNRDVVPGNRLIIANGNNLVIEGDLVNRAVLIQLDCPLERPEERKFDWDPVERALRGRQQFILDILTILRAYHLALEGGHAPKKLTPMGGFEKWSALVRGALVWLGEADVYDNKDELRKNDPERVGVASVIAAWHDEFGLKSVTAKMLLEGKPDAQGQAIDRPLRDAIENALDNERPSALQLGKWLQKMKGKVSGLHRIETGDEDSHAKVNLWKLKNVQL